jgi:hypothetical protein
VVKAVAVAVRNASLRSRLAPLAGQLANLTGAEGYLETEIRTRLGLQSFQKPDQIADAVRLFSSVELWKELGAQLGEDPHDLKVQLKLIVDRRNKIAHEADIDPSYPGQRRRPCGRREARRGDLQARSVTGTDSSEVQVITTAGWSTKRG